MNKTFVLSLSMSFLGLNPVLAQGLADPCLADLQEYCANIERGGGRSMNCLLEHKENLTLACRARVTRTNENLSKLRKSCDKELNKLCDQLEPGEGRLVRCLEENDDKLSSGCRKEIDKARQAKRSIIDTI